MKFEHSNKFDSSMLLWASKFDTLKLRLTLNWTSTVN